MDSLNQTALMKLENHAVDINEYLGLLGHFYLFYLLAKISYFAQNFALNNPTMLSIFMMPIVVTGMVNYFKVNLLGFFELAASITRKYKVAKNVNPIFLGLFWKKKEVITPSF